MGRTKEENIAYYLNQTVNLAGPWLAEGLTELLGQKNNSLLDAAREKGWLALDAGFGPEIVAAEKLGITKVTANEPERRSGGDMDIWAQFAPAVLELLGKRLGNGINLTLMNSHPRYVVDHLQLRDPDSKFGLVTEIQIFPEDCLPVAVEARLRDLSPIVASGGGVIVSSIEGLEGLRALEKAAELIREHLPEYETETVELPMTNYLGDAVLLAVKK